jgi:CcmD family protein
MRTACRTIGLYVTGVAAMLFLLPASLAGQAQSEFVPAESLPQEVLPATPFVFVAYAFVWLVLLVYVFGLWRRLGRVERELADVTARIRRSQSGP